MTETPGSLGCTGHRRLEGRVDSGSKHLSSLKDVGLQEMRSRKYWTGEKALKPWEGWREGKLRVGQGRLGAGLRAKERQRP